MFGGNRGGFDRLPDAENEDDDAPLLPLPSGIINC